VGLFYLFTAKGTKELGFVFHAVTVNLFTKIRFGDSPKFSQQNHLFDRPNLYFLAEKINSLPGNINSLP
jgi:hypothetical protein